MATVYRARDRRLGREVAVKVIHPHLRDSREVASRFGTEAHAVAMLRHPNIVEVYDVSEQGDAEQYLVAELVVGPTLRKLLLDRGPMPAEVAAAVALQLAGALAHANGHGVVHRDVKPENVLIERKPPPSHPGSDSQLPSASPRATVKLTDFGIAKLLDVQGVTTTGQVLGSPAHMAPEQIEGGEVDARSDVYGLGVVFYECVVGHLPFEGANPAQVLRKVLDGVYSPAHVERPAVGARWSGIVDRAIARSRPARFADAGAVSEAIAAELDRLGFPAPKTLLEEWLEDATAYAATHDAGLIAKLCALAGEARKGGDAISAAGDYNRALALAPDDPNLLRIVTGLQRAERRARGLRRVAAAGAVVVGLASAAGIGVHMFRARAASSSVVAIEPVPGRGAEALAGSEPDRAVEIAADAAPRLGARPARPALRMATPVHDTPAKVIDRRLTLDLKPPMGVSVSVDGQVAVGVSTGEAVTVDGKAHSLAFTCPVCTPVDVSVSAGDKDDTLVVSVPIHPATLVVDGATNGTYQIVEHPEVAVRAGANIVALRSAFERITVKRIETGDAVPVRLEAAKTVHASFP
jgi:eukaryotic-like serine/threonine-protein kinase